MAIVFFKKWQNCFDSVQSKMGGTKEGNHVPCPWGSYGKGKNRVTLKKKWKTNIRQNQILSARKEEKKWPKKNFANKKGILLKWALQLCVGEDLKENWRKNILGSENRKQRPTGMSIRSRMRTAVCFWSSVPLRLLSKHASHLNQDFILPLHLG